MKNGMLDAADVLVHREPVGDGLAANRAGLRFRVGIAIEVPTGIKEGVHRIGLTTRGLAAFGTRGVDKVRHFSQRRMSRPRELHVFRKQYGKLVFGNGHRSAAGAIDDGNRRAPVPLAGDAPIFQAKLHGPGAESARLGISGHFLDGLVRIESRIVTGIDQRRVEAEDALAVGRELILGGHDLADRKAELCTEIVVTFVVGGHGHDGARAVLHQDEVRYPDRHRFSVKRILGDETRVESVFLKIRFVGQPCRLLVDQLQFFLKLILPF